MEAPSLLWIVSYLLHPSGQAEEARTFLMALEDAGCAPAALELKGDGRSAELDERMLEVVVRALERRPEPPVVAVHHYTPRPEVSGLPGATNVARAMWETDRIPAGWAELLAQHEAVWVPSEHNRNTFAAGGVAEEAIRVIPETLDFSAFRPGVEPLDLGVPRGHFAFLANFDFSERKGWRELLLAWARAFAPHDPVCLVLKTLSVAQWQEAYVERRIEEFVSRAGAAAGGTAPVRILADVLPAARMPALYSAADAFVSASRGEAWGRPYMEAMAVGLPTIGTRYGGNLDFMSDERCWLVDGQLEPISDGAEVLSELYRGHQWFVADVDELADRLREVAGDPEAARRRAAPARTELMERFAPPVVARGIMDAARDALSS